jgi:hypothetical protein
VASQDGLGYMKVVIYLFILTANGFLPGDNGTTIRQHTNNTPHSRKIQHTKLHKKQRTHYTMNTMQIQLQLCKLILTLGGQFTSINGIYG